ncbi:MAG: CPBP family intramembrane glutamic endopeptidase [Acidobacteriaceae bacterium]
MKVSENTSESPSSLVAWPNRTSPVAPWWHTAIIVAILLCISILSTLQSRSAGFGGGHIKRYIITIAWECFLGLIAWWGLRMRRTPVREVLGLRRPGFKEFARDFGVALIFWIIAIIILAAISLLLHLAHLMHEQKAVIALAPQTLLQIIVWIALCIIAGIVEEFVFRGYLLQQFSSIRSKLWIGVLISSLLFGAAHGYEGIGGMIAIVVYGVMFCLLAIQRRSLRAGMIAHAWHDAFTGILIVVARHNHLL